MVRFQVQIFPKRAPPSSAPQVMPTYIPTYVTVQMRTPFCVYMPFIFLLLNRNLRAFLELESHFKQVCDLSIFIHVRI